MTSCSSPTSAVSCFVLIRDKISVKTQKWSLLVLSRRMLSNIVRTILVKLALTELVKTDQSFKFPTNTDICTSRTILTSGTQLCQNYMLWWLVGCIKIHFSLSSICLGPRSVPVGTGRALAKYFLNRWWFTAPTWRLNITIILQWHNHQKSGTIPGLASLCQ